MPSNRPLLEQAQALEIQREMKSIVHPYLFSVCVLIAQAAIGPRAESAVLLEAHDDEQTVRQAPGGTSVPGHGGMADLPRQMALPDPLVMFDGQKVNTREKWISERRPELIRLFQHYMYGQLPSKPAAVTGKV